MLEFKLNLYFEEYKDACALSFTRFKNKFIKKHGNFTLIPELFNMIQKYQYTTYGTLLEDGKLVEWKVAKGEYSKLANKRYRARFGNKLERELRRRRYDNE